MTRRSAKRRAFTLVEMLVSIALLALLAAGIAALTDDLRLRRAGILNIGEANRAADAVIDALEADLATTFVADRDGKPGIAGGPRSLTLRSRTVPLILDDAEDPTTASTRSRIEFDPDARELLAWRGSDAETGEASQPTLVTQRIKSLRFRYHDGQAWRASFDSAAAGELPVAVEVTLLFAPARDPDPEPSRPGDDLIPQASIPEPPPIPDGLALGPAADDDPFAEWLTDGRRRVIAIPDARAASADAAQPGRSPGGASP